MSLLFTYGRNTFSHDVAHFVVCHFHYYNDPKFSDTQVWANSVDPYQTVPEQSDQSLHYLTVCLHLLNTLLYGKTTLFKF